MKNYSLLLFLFLVGTFIPQLAFGVCDAPPPQFGACVPNYQYFREGCERPYQLACHFQNPSCFRLVFWCEGEEWICNASCLCDANLNCQVKTGAGLCLGDGWYNVGEPYPCTKNSFSCTCQDQEYRDYFCSNASCVYNVLAYRTLYQCPPLAKIVIPVVRLKDALAPGEWFEIDVSDSKDDTGISWVRFSADQILDGKPSGIWDGPYLWESSEPEAESGPWEIDRYALKHLTLTNLGWQRETVDLFGKAGYLQSQLGFEFGEDNSLHVSYYDATSLYAQRYANWDGNWEIEIVKEKAINSQSSLALDSNGFAHLLFSDKDGLHYAKWDGKQWKIETITSGGGGLALALDQNDQAHFLQCVGNRVKYGRKTQTEWQIETVYFNPGVSMNCYNSLVLDSNDRAHFSFTEGPWLSGESYFFQIHYFFFDGKEWKKSSSPLMEGKFQPQSSIVLDHLNQAKISFPQPDPQGAKINVCQIKNRVWNCDGFLESKLPAAVFSVLDRAENLHLYYYSSANRDLSYLQWLPSGWQKKEESNIFYPSHQVLPPFFLDLDQNPHFVIYDQARVKYWKLDQEGTYEVWVEVTDTEGLTDLAYQIVKVLKNQPPSAKNLLVEEGDYCFATSPPIYLTWEFSDPDPGDSQSAYQVQVDDQSDFSSPEIDSGKVLSSSQEYFAQNLSFGQSYWWRLKVWDNHDKESDWTLGPQFSTNPHPYPEPDFEFWPTSPVAKQKIQFTDLSSFYDSSGSWFWDFGDGQSSSLQNPTHVYSESGTYWVTLSVTDQDGCGPCSILKSIKVEAPLPWWKEIIPWLFSISLFPYFYSLFPNP